MPLFDIPSPAPPNDPGARLVVAMMVGYIAVDHAITVPADERDAADPVV
jgi:XapX domain-containing protein